MSGRGRQQQQEPLRAEVYGYEELAVDVLAKLRKGVRPAVKAAEVALRDDKAFLGQNETRMLCAVGETERKMAVDEDSPMPGSFRNVV